MRMYGMSDPQLKINPMRGVQDWAEDLEIFISDKLGLRKSAVHVVAHSLGALVAFRLLANRKVPIARLTLYAPPPPHGYATNGPDPSFVNALEHKDREFIIKVVNATFWHPSYKHPDLEQIIDSVLQMQTGPGAYPEAIIEAVSPWRNQGLKSTLLTLMHKPPITWVYGHDDVLVANHGFAAPNERMVDDIREFLEQYADNGGSFEEIGYPSCGHSPFLEIPTEADRLLLTL